MQNCNELIYNLFHENFIENVPRISIVSAVGDKRPEGLTENEFGSRDLNKNEVLEKVSNKDILVNSGPFFQEFVRGGTGGGGASTKKDHTILSVQR
jgi:hypothetical protein